MFCYCPLFLLACPGEFSVLPTGMKDCSRCVIPHAEGGWEMIQSELGKQIYNQDPQRRLPLE